MRSFTEEQKQREAERQTPSDAIAREQRAFEFGGRVLYAKESVPANTIYMLGKIGGSSDLMSDARNIAAIIDSVLEEDSLKDLDDVMSGRARSTWVPAAGQTEADRPIIPDTEALQTMMTMLLEGVAGRPLDQASDSQAASSPQKQDGGTPSTDASQPTEAAV